MAPGGYDTGELLTALTARLTADGITPVTVTGHRLEQAHPFGALAECINASCVLDDANDTPGATEQPAVERRCRDLLLDRLRSDDAALIVDDAQWLDAATLRVLVGVVERANDLGPTVIAAHRPVARHTTLAALDAALSRRQPLLRLAPLSQEDVAERAARVLGHEVDAPLVEVLHEQSGGIPALVDQLAIACVATTPTATTTGQRDDHGPGTPLAGPVGMRSNVGYPSETVAARGRMVPAGIADVVRIEVDQLPAVGRMVLGALSAGADLDDELLACVTGLAPDELGEAIELLQGAGLLAEHSKEVVPAVAAAMAELVTLADRRRFHATLAAALAARGAPPTQIAEHLAAAGAHGTDAAAAFVAAGEASLRDAPELARVWFDRAASAGAESRQLAAARAEAAAFDGDGDLALRIADAVVSDTGAPHRQRAMGVVAALLPARGFWQRSAEVYRALVEDNADLDGRSRATSLLELIASVIAGSGPRGTSGSAPVALARSSMPDSDAASASPSVSLEVEALALTARGLVTSLAPDVAGIEPAFLEAAELLEAAHARLLLPDTPHALGATVALALCEPTTAEHLLNRALERDVGGRALRLRHRLLLGWVAVRSGRWSAAQAALDEARGQQAAPRERLLAAAIDAGLARRAGDLPRLTGVWRAAEGVLLSHRPDLLSLDPVGELTITASRLGQWDRVAATAHALGDVLRALGEPPLWLLPLRWTGLQVALASDDHEAARRRAAEITAVAPVQGRLKALPEAARTWVAILDGTVEPAEVAAASDGLRALRLTWEASRLTGQAAIRSSNPSVTRALLEQARNLRSALPTSEADQAPNVARVLSEREQMVAQFIVDGLTYKEIGAQLYISPKTVEHHVAKIRQKLGATTRAQMLAALRTL